MRRYFKLFFTLLKFKISRRMVYSYDFWSAFFADIILFLVQLLTFSTIFNQVDKIGSWGINEVIVFIGTFTIVDGLAMATYFFGIISIPEKIRTGALDIYITKPVNTLFYVAYDNMNPGSFLVALSGLLIVAYGVIGLGIKLTLIRILGYAVLVILMYSLMFSLMLIIRTAAFWFIRIDSLMDIENQVIEFAFRVPGVVYKGVMKIILWIIVPYGLIATVPTQFLTGILSGQYWVLAIGVSAGFFILSVLIFNRGLSVYSSASS